MGQLKYKGYAGSVEYNEEDNCLFGKVLGLKKDCITYEGETISELKSDFEGAIDDYLASCKDRGVEPSKPYSGKLVLRMPSDLHGMVATAAANAGTTINEFINRAVTKELEKELIIVPEEISDYEDGYIRGIQYALEVLREEL